MNSHEKFKNVEEEDFKISEDVQKQLENLGLETSDFSGKILDVGAGEAFFAEELSQKEGVDITSLDNNVPDDRKDKVIEGSVANLPFEDESFDLVISHASIPNIFIELYDFDEDKSNESKKEIESAIDRAFSEILRVLKPGGEARLSPIALAENYSSQKALKEAILNSLKKIDVEVDFQFMETHKNPDNQEESDFYRLIIKK